MAGNLMAYPDLRHPFESKPLHAAGQATVLAGGKRFTVDGAAERLLVTNQLFNEITGFSVKPEGACLGDLCVPLTADLTESVDGDVRIDLEAFATAMGQAFVADRDARAWSFAEIPARRDHLLVDGLAPDFRVTDRAGNVLQLADLKGKKALIVTWSSW